MIERFKKSNNTKKYKLF